MSTFSLEIFKSNLELAPDFFHFSKWKISKDQVFAVSELSFAFVNTKPVTPGHVLVCPIRIVKTINELTSEELYDFWELARFVRKISCFQNPPCEDCSFVIQDGPRAGQTVPHVHVHILPRHDGDVFNVCKKNDKIYDGK